MVGRMDTCVRMAEFLHCPPETIAALLMAVLQYKIETFSFSFQRANGSNGHSTGLGSALSASL